MNLFPSSGSLAGLTALIIASAGFACAAESSTSANSNVTHKRPNVIVVLADQMRAQATGYAGDPNLKGKTPHLDRLADEGVNFINAVSTLPVCTPFRGSLLTGRYPLSTGLFINDVPLASEEISIAEVYKAQGYDTGFIGKWHVDGQGRTEYIPPERRQGFDYWKVLECTHKYLKSPYYDNNDQQLKYWEGYDVLAQTKDAQAYIAKHAASDKPFVLFLAWGTPHSPYTDVPDTYKQLFDEDKLVKRPNVLPGKHDAVLAKFTLGYYAHIAAIDESIGNLLKTIHDTGIENDTILLFSSDHGDMLGSKGAMAKQRPYAESAETPMLIRYPAVQRVKGAIKTPIGTPDLMPTLLGLSKIPVPLAVEGTDLSPLIRGERPAEDRPVLIECIVPFADWANDEEGCEYRGIKTQRYTYVRNLKGPWLLFDNQADPYQMKNLIGTPQVVALQGELDAQLNTILEQQNDKFLPQNDYLKKWNYRNAVKKEESLKKKNQQDSDQ